MYIGTARKPQGHTLNERTDPFGGFGGHPVRVQSKKLNHALALG